MKHALLVLFLIAVSSATAHAQASIAGVVRSAEGGALPNVNVEATSPQLIERVRTAVTDGTGHYRIVDLRPGLYDVVFTLASFTPVKHERIELTGSFTATVNANLRAGAGRELLVVDRETPMVDVQSAKRETTITNEVFNALPTAKSYSGLMVLVPAIIATSTDSQVTPRMLGFSGSGGRTGGEGRLQTDGLSTGFVGGSGVSPYVADLQNAAEVSFTTSGSLGEAEASGPVLSVVPRTGSNSLKGSVYTAGVSGWMVGDNYNQSLKDAGLITPGALLKLWDFNGALGGPVVKDRLWFFTSVRDQGSHRSVPGMYANLNSGDPAEWTYVPDLTRPAHIAGSWTIANARVTAQVTPRNKINLFWDEQIACLGAPWTADVGGCREQTRSGPMIAGGAQSAGIGPTTTATNAPETATYTGGGTPQRVQQATWQSPATERLLLEAGFGTYLARLGGQEIPGNPTRDIVRVTEQCTLGCAANGNIAGLMYRSNNWSSNWQGNHNWRASASYVLGAQNIKVGYQGGFLVSDEKNFTNNQNLAFRFDNAVPNQLTQLLLPFQIAQRTRYDAVYAQDQWTHRRLTLQGALRFDHAWSWFPASQIGPTRFLQSPMVFPETKGVDSYRDISPRMGAAYDLFGTGRTSIKVNLGRYLEVAQTGGTYSGTRPTARVSTSATRRWADRNGDFVPDCDLSSPLSNGECGQISDFNFGKPVFSNTYDPALLSGWGIRPSDWSFGASIQHEVVPRVSVEVGYFRRWLAGFTVIDNRAQVPADFGSFSVNAPLDARLPNGGQTISGLYNVNQDVASSVDNYVTWADTYGNQYQHYDGMLINVNARPRAGLTFQGGINTGKTVADNCEIRARLPEIAPTNPYCHTDSGLISRFTGLGAYTIPKLDVQVAATIRSDPGAALAANYSVDNATVARSLGRNLSNMAANVTVNLVAPGTLYGERVNELNLRFAKILKYGRTRTDVGLDVNNVLNSAAILTYNAAFIPGGAWLTPTSILQSRYLKISAQVDF